MPTSIHKHFNLRKICDLQLSNRVLLDLQTARLDQLGRPHIVTIETPMGPLVLFRVLGNNKPYVVTLMPEVAEAISTGRVKASEAAPVGSQLIS